MVKKKSIKEEKKINKLKEIQVKKEIPEEIKVLFGKFYVFSFIYLFFFFVVYPFLLVEKLRVWSSVIIFVLLGGFYIYMIGDVLSHKGRYSSTAFLFLILLVLTAMSFSLVKFIV